MNPKIRKELITNIKKYRLDNNISQLQLAELVGVRRETIIRLEKGEYNPSLELAYDIAKVFEVSIEEIFMFQ